MSECGRLSHFAQFDIHLGKKTEMRSMLVRTVKHAHVNQEGQRGYLVRSMVEV